MSAYFIILMGDPTRPELLDEYRRLGVAAFANSGGRFVAVPGGDFECVEGDMARSAVIIEFDTMAEARAYYHGQAYQDAVKLRLQAVPSHAVLVEGVSKT